MADYDPRIVELYDEDNPDGPDHDFYRALADEVGAASVLDLGCGTGILTVTLARPGRTVVGVDPSATMLRCARRRPGADAVTWASGDSGEIPDARFDCAVMSGNVAQHIPDPMWTRTLSDLHRHLAPGGVLAFESRNPQARAWEGWARSERTARPTRHGELLQWMDAEEVAPGVVDCTFHNLFADGDEVVTEVEQLTFRDRTTLERQLRDAGFDVEAVYGDWHRTPFRGSEPLMIFVARV